MRWNVERGRLRRLQREDEAEKTALFREYVAQANAAEAAARRDDVVALAKGALGERQGLNTEEVALLVEARVAGLTWEQACAKLAARGNRISEAALERWRVAVALRAEAARRPQPVPLSRKVVGEHLADLEFVKLALRSERED